MGFPRVSLIFPNPHRLTLAAVWAMHFMHWIGRLALKGKSKFLQKQLMWRTNHIRFRVKQLPERDTQRLTIHTVWFSCSLNAFDTWCNWIDSQEVRLEGTQQRLETGSMQIYRMYLDRYPEDAIKWSSGLLHRNQNLSETDETSWNQAAICLNLLLIGHRNPFLKGAI